ncbi:unnamed protein product, partial [Fusarium graminearum]
VKPEVACTASLHKDTKRRNKDGSKHLARVTGKQLAVMSYLWLMVKRNTEDVRASERHVCGYGRECRETGVTGDNSRTLEFTGICRISDGDLIYRVRDIASAQPLSPVVLRLWTT